VDRSTQLDRLLRPSSVAVVGASTRAGWGLETIANLDGVGFTGEIYPVNPRYDEVAGRRCYPSLRDLPSAPDAAVLAVPARVVPAAVGDAIATGIGAAVVYASGFGASGQGEGGDHSGNVPRRELLDHTRSKQIAVLGPNCLGSINYAGRAAMWGISMPFAHAGVDSGVALVAQSGNMALTLAGANRGLSFTHVISCGNQLDVSVAELFEACLRDPAVRVLAGLIEGVPDIAHFRQVLDAAAERDIPVVILKVGESERGQAATVAHTGSLSGSAALYRALFRQCGVIQVSDLDELMAVCALLSAPRRPRATGVAVFASSGGEVGLISDLGETLGISYPDIPASVSTAIAALLPDFGRVSNPLDITAGGWGDAELYPKVISELAKVEGVDTIVGVADAPTLESGELIDGWWGIINGMVEGARVVGPDGPTIVNLTTIGDVHQQIPGALLAGGVVPLVGLQPALAALSKVARRTRWAAAAKALVSEDPSAGSRVAAVTDLLSGLPAGAQSEDLAKRVLAHYGIDSPRRRLAGSVDEAVTAAAEVGYPVVLKVAAAGVSHKTEIGGVRIDLETPEAVARGAAELLAVGASVSEGDDALVLVEAFAPPGLELIIGGRQDPMFGPVVMVGLGGVLTELLADVSHRLAPVVPGEVSAMLDELTAASLLDGYRGRPAVDRAVLAGVVSAASLLLAEHPQITELDINPLVFDPERGTMIALDALVVLADRA
jgi:acyl-CoA synthetase (NDP forming)